MQILKVIRIHNEKYIHDHNHLMSRYYLHCINEKYSKKVKLFDKLEDFRDNLIQELDYIKNINENKLNFDIDMKNLIKKNLIKLKNVYIVIKNLMKIIIIEKLL